MKLFEPIRFRKNPSSIVLLIIFVLVFVFILIPYFNNETRVQERESVCNYSVNDFVTKKYICYINHMYRAIILKKTGLAESHTTDEIWDRVEIGDSISKEKTKTYAVIYKRNGDTAKVIITDMKCN